MVSSNSWRQHHRVITQLTVGSLASILVSGCFQENHLLPSTKTHLDLMLFTDHTGSVKNLQDQIIKLAVQVAASAPPKTLVEASTFGSEIQVAPFFTGVIRKPAAFKAAVAEALAKPARGRGTFGEPLLKRIREKIKLTGQPTIAILLSDCGFNDLAEMHKEAGRLENEPLLLALYAMPAVSQNSAYTKLEAALSPLGKRARIAASADSQEALREIQALLRTGGRTNGR